MSIFGVIGYLMRKFRYEAPPLHFCSRPRPHNGKCSPTVTSDVRRKLQYLFYTADLLRPSRLWPHLILHTSFTLVQEEATICRPILDANQTSNTAPTWPVRNRPANSWRVECTPPSLYSGKLQ